MNDIDELRESLHKRNMILFVGAGLSSGAGLPGWYKLVSELAQQIDYELPPERWVSAEVLIDAAQAYINEKGMYSLVAFLKDQLDTTGMSPTPVHRTLTRLPVSLLLTANYDDFLERAYQKAGKRVRVVVRDRDIPFMEHSPDAVNIIKLYGDLNQPNTIVLAREQYEAYFLQRPQIVKLLETELGRSHVLYLGWSHTDPHFNLVFGELLNHFGVFTRPGYAVMFDLPEAQRKELQRKHIRLVELPASGDRTAQLAAWLDILAMNDRAG
ncbi:MAG: SIR2 family protein [Anaerolineae bacterium]